MIAQLYALLQTRRTGGWFLAALLFAGICGFAAWQHSTAAPYLIQDDARQHIVWWRQAANPALFQHDLIATYFQSVAPAGFKALVVGAAKLGLDPVLLSKILPLLLGLLAAGLCFWLAMEICPLPAGAFLASVLLTINLWIKDDLASGTPRAFFAPFMLLFLLAVMRAQWLWVCLAVLLQGLFYPQMLLLSGGVLACRLAFYRDGKWGFVRERKTLLMIGGGLVVTVGFLGWLFLNPTSFGPVISKAQALAMPEFQEGGRSSFFLTNPGKFWLFGPRSGLLPTEWNHWPLLLFLPLGVGVIAMGVAFPWIHRRFKNNAFWQRLSFRPGILVAFLISGLVCFVLAHLVLFKLHLPSRYAPNMFRLILPIGAGLMLAASAGLLSHWAEQHKKVLGSFLVSIVVLGVFLLPLALPWTNRQFPSPGYVRGTAPALYQFVEKLPLDSRFASLSDEANNLPAFANRSILAGSEFAIPYHRRYYREFQQNSQNTILLLTTPDAAEFERLIRETKVTHFLLETDWADSEHLVRTALVRQYPEQVARIEQRAKMHQVSVLAKSARACTIFEQAPYYVVEAGCVLKAGVSHL